MARTLWLPKRTLAELREIKRCASLAARGKPFVFQAYQHKRGTDPIAHVAEAGLLALKGAISDLLISHGSIVRGLLAQQCGTVAREIVARLTGWQVLEIAAQHDRWIEECRAFEESGRPLRLVRQAA